MIRFDVLFKNNLVADCEAACFGWLSTANDEWYRRSKIQTNNNKYLGNEFGNGNLVAQELMWYVGKTFIPGEGGEDDAWRIVKEIVPEFPWLNDTVLLRPATKTVHVKLGNTPCDQSILCIGIIRNFFMVPSFRASYNKARDLGASVKEAYIFAGLVEVNSDWQGNWSAVTRDLWEYDSLNSATFGRKALKAMFEPNYSPWQQGTWEEQRGYNREATINEDFVGFDGEVRQKKLLDVFSVEDDDEILHHQQGIHTRDNAGVTNIINVIRQAMQA